MILGIGLDLCQIERIERAIARPRFLERVYTPAERARPKASPACRRTGKTKDRTTWVIPCSAAYSQLSGSLLRLRPRDESLPPASSAKDSVLLSPEILYA